MKPKRRRRSIRRKYKGLVAAMAGAAVLSSSMLPGLPAARAHAAVIPNVTEKSETAQPQAGDVAEKPAPAGEKTRETKGQPDKAPLSSPLEVARSQAREYGFDARHDRFSLQWSGDNDAVVLITTEDGAQYKMRLERSRSGQWSVTSVRELDKDIPSGSNDPVRVVKDNASTYGFDARDDAFTLLSLAGSKAIVQVRTGGQTFKVDLERQGGTWQITTIRGIGNMKYPATYTPASMFKYTAPLPAPVVLPQDQTTIYSTGDYQDWSWNQALYPSDMSMGVILSTSQLVGSAIFIPDAVRDQIKNVDLGRQFVLFANLGSAPSQGYGIAIEKVTQNGNNLYVTVAAKSPLASDRTDTKFSDYLLVDRDKLDFGSPIHIYFLDRNNMPLSTFMVIPR